MRVEESRKPRLQLRKKQQHKKNLKRDKKLPEKRSDPQGDMFADELNEAEEAELARMEAEEEKAKRKTPMKLN